MSAPRFSDVYGVSDDGLLVLITRDLDDAGVWERMRDVGAGRVCVTPDALPWMREHLIACAYIVPTDDETGCALLAEHFTPSGAVVAAECALSDSDRLELGEVGATMRTLARELAR